ncbi:FAD-dependent oxidoreductase [Pinisolibacter sp. B13]|uniref:NAD(P)/FAD-dependent oxidoreductase n=2 Tax=Pinisolibacter aquiterrae TaxID=2815579 RepID=UPI001C3D5FB2|nr:FAD-dependent oxidoreductase [Pinisolibacter aquiterrae]MBV5263749.1 FAD-dependent oxidoreductase [Pinisolibacter aquiterrae]
MAERVVVVGAGAVGAAIALEAQARGLAVTLVEPGPPGGDQAASFGNAAWISLQSVIPPSEPGVWKKIPGYLLDPLGPLAIRPLHMPGIAPWLLRYMAAGWTPARIAAIARILRPLLAEAPDLHRALARDAGVPELIAGGGLMHVWKDRAGFEAEATTWGVRRAVGIEWDEVEGEALRALQPDLSPDYRFAVRVGDSAHCRDPGGYVAALVAHAERRGAGVVKARAVDFTFSGGRLTGVVTEAGTIPAERAVIAAGIRSTDLAVRLGLRVPMESERGYHVQFEGLDLGPVPPVMIQDRKVAITRLATGLRVAGQVELAGVDARANWRRAEVLKTHLLAVFPGLAEAIRSARAVPWLGHRPSTPDGRPVIGRSPHPDVLVAYGHGHIGLASAPRTGRIVADLLVGRAPEIALDGFSPARFDGFGGI